MNIHEAVLHSCTVIARQQPAVAGRQKSEISARQQAPAQLNSARGRSFAKIILYHFRGGSMLK